MGKPKLEVVKPAPKPEPDEEEDWKDEIGEPDPVVRPPSEYEEPDPWGGD